MKIKFRNILLAITLTVFSALLGVGYCNFLARKNIDTYIIPQEGIFFKLC